jgi:endonuclease/exonuclease/phosphatase family metal-dependent hydrolase
MSPVRLVTYNVHGCRGSDRRLSPARVLSVIARIEPHVVALQEIERPEHAEYFARELGMELFFVAARERLGLAFGNAILTRLPGTLVRAAGLPRLHSGTEARAAQWARLQADFGALDVVNTHLGLLPDERILQAECLMGSDWLGGNDVGRHAVLCGDLNARPGTLAYFALCRSLIDVPLAQGRARATFPAVFPLVRIDHVLSRPGLLAERVEVPSHFAARVASDHRPLVVDLRSRDEGLA